MIKALIRLGFVERPGEGSHTVPRSGSVVTVVPHANPVRPGTLRNLLRQAQVTVDELIAVL